MTEDWKGYIRCFHCDKKIRFDESYMYNDLSVCGVCNNFLIELTKKKPKHPLEDFDEKHIVEDKQKKKKNK
jgi:hypothetical protein